MELLAVCISHAAQLDCHRQGMLKTCGNSSRVISFNFIFFIIIEISSRVSSCILARHEIDEEKYVRQKIH